MMNEIETPQTEPKYLKPYQHYADLYDRYTVERCREIESKTIPCPNKKGKKKVDIEKLVEDSIPHLVRKFQLHTVQGERYANKKTVIDEWMARDEKRDQLMESAQAPRDITCLTCGRLMFVTSKHLWTAMSDKDRVMFFYDCPLKHVPRRAFYDDGEEWKKLPNPCPKCGTEMDRETERATKDSIISIDRCPSCKYTHRYKMDLTETKEMIDPDFAKDRARFCSEKEGQEYLDFKYKIKGLAELSDSIKRKEENKESLELVAKLKKLKIIDVEQLLGPVLEAGKFIKLQFQTPEVGKDVIVGFSVHDAKGDRDEWKSKKELEKMIKVNLQGTNWKLMTDGVNYRLGMLSGRLRGYEKEEDLLELVQSKKKSK